MNIGDKVRSLHGKEEGIIRRIIDNRTVEVEIEDGFLIPFLKNELVIISGEENERFGKQEQKDIIKPDNSVKKEMSHDFGAFFAIGNEEGEISFWLLNQTPHTILFTVHEQESQETRGIAYGTLKEYAYSKIERHNQDNSRKWPFLIVDVLIFQRKEMKFLPPVSKRININKELSGRKSTFIQWIGKKVVLLDLIADNVKIDPEIIKASMLTPKNITIPPRTGKNQQHEIIDLHIDSLVSDTSILDQTEILNIQIAHFEKKLDQAVISGQNVITFIHGVGNGVLRHQIHKKLSKYPHIRFFEDAQKEKFGYGATKVYLK